MLLKLVFLFYSQTHFYFFLLISHFLFQSGQRSNAGARHLRGNAGWVLEPPSTRTCGGDGRGRRGTILPGEVTKFVKETLEVFSFFPNFFFLYFQFFLYFLYVLPQ